MGEILLIIWAISLLVVFIVLSWDGICFLVFRYRNDCLDRRIGVLYRAGMYESGDILKPQFIESWRDLYKRYF